MVSYWVLQGFNGNTAIFGTESNDSLTIFSPNYVVWWAEKVTDVSWKEAFKRYDLYIQHGPDTFAFDFKLAFDEFGERILLKNLESIILICIGSRVSPY